jgi:hypothetical protein
LDSQRATNGLHPGAIEGHSLEIRVELVQIVTNLIYSHLLGDLEFTILVKGLGFKKITNFVPRG